MVGIVKRECAAILYTHGARGEPDSGLDASVALGAAESVGACHVLPNHGGEFRDCYGGGTPQYGAAAARRHHVQHLGE